MQRLPYGTDTPGDASRRCDVSLTTGGTRGLRVAGNSHPLPSWRGGFLWRERSAVGAARCDARRARRRVPALVRLIGWMGCPPFRTHGEETMISRRYPSVTIRRRGRHSAHRDHRVRTAHALLRSPLKCYAIKDFLHVKLLHGRPHPRAGGAAGFQRRAGPQRSSCRRSSSRIDVRKDDERPAAAAFRREWDVQCARLPLLQDRMPEAAAVAAAGEPGSVRRR